MPGGGTVPSESLRIVAMRLRRAVGPEGRASLATFVETEARASTAWGFANEADPQTGTPWPSRRPRGEDDDSHQLLQKTGELRRSITHRIAITPNSVMVILESSLTKAHAHMRGFRAWIESAGGMILPNIKRALHWPTLARPVRLARAHWVTVPKRRFGGLTPQSRLRIGRRFKEIFRGRYSA